MTRSSATLLSFRGGGALGCPKLARYRGTVVSPKLDTWHRDPHRGMVKAACVPGCDSSPSFLHTFAAKTN